MKKLIMVLAILGLLLARPAFAWPKLVEQAVGEAAKAVVPKSPKEAKKHKKHKPKKISIGFPGDPRVIDEVTGKGKEKKKPDPKVSEAIKEFEKAFGNEKSDGPINILIQAPASIAGDVVKKVKDVFSDTDVSVDVSLPKGSEIGGLTTMPRENNDLEREIERELPVGLGAEDDSSGGGDILGDVWDFLVGVFGNDDGSDDSDSDEGEGEGEGESEDGYGTYVSTGSSDNSFSSDDNGESRRQPAAETNEFGYTREQLAELRRQWENSIESFKLAYRQLMAEKTRLESLIPTLGFKYDKAKGEYESARSSYEREKGYISGLEKARNSCLKKLNTLKENYGKTGTAYADATQADMDEANSAFSQAEADYFAKKEECRNLDENYQAAKSVYEPIKKALFGAQLKLSEVESELREKQETLNGIQNFEDWLHGRQ